MCTYMYIFIKNYTFCIYACININICHIYFMHIHTYPNGVYMYNIQGQAK